MTTDHHHLRVLIANEREDRIALVTHSSRDSATRS